MLIIVGATSLSVHIYERGRTAHSTFRILITNKIDHLESKIYIDSQRGQFLADADVIIWDEILMAYKKAIECVHTLLRDITSVNAAFGESFSLA